MALTPKLENIIVEGRKLTLHVTLHQDAAEPILGRLTEEINLDHYPTRAAALIAAKAGLKMKWDRWVAVQIEADALRTEAAVLVAGLTG